MWYAPAETCEINTLNLNFCSLLIYVSLLKVKTFYCRSSKRTSSSLVSLNCLKCLSFVAWISSFLEWSPRFLFNFPLILERKKLPDIGPTLRPSFSETYFMMLKSRSILKHWLSMFWRLKYPWESRLKNFACTFENVTISLGLKTHRSTFWLSFAAGILSTKSIFWFSLPCSELFST